MEEKILKLLPHISVPSRYTGNEINAVHKEFEKCKIKFALCYPDLYELGMSSLGIRILYGFLNEDEDIVCERVFSPWIDMEDLLKSSNIPLFSLESKRPLKEFDVIGFSISSELNYTNVLNILSLADIPVLVSERREDDPIILAGGSCIFNFAPLEPFIDCFVVGEGENVILEIVEVLKETKDRGREKVLSALASLEGVYIPSYPKERVKKRFVKDLDNVYVPLKWIVPLTEIVHDRISIEIMRGCGQGCFFCQAGRCWRPVRTKSPEKILEIARETYRNTGYEEISLLSFSSGDHLQIDKIVDKLLSEFKERKVTISFPSIRIDTFSFELATKIKEIKKTGLTFAPETGERLREKIGKRIKDSELISLVQKAKEGGWYQIKLYFMLGLPEEKDSDIIDIANLINEISYIIGVKASFNTFIPKPHTIFERERFITEEEYLHKKSLIVKSVRRSNRIKLNFHSYHMSCIEAVLSRGDKVLSSVIKKVWEKGGKMENWDEYFNFSLWVESFYESGTDISYYLSEIQIEMPLPWHRLIV
ncbi:MAG: radical SAM protein [bacterium]|nr:radical SAM protein [bacterium]